MIVTRYVDPLTGGRAMDRARRTWARAASPELAIVQAVLRTPLGSAARDATYGLEPTDNAAPNAAALVRQRVLTALARWIASGTLRDVTVDVETSRNSFGDTELRFRVSFKGRSTGGATQTFRSDQ